MSDQQKKPADRRYLGKFQAKQTQYGAMYSILMDNYNHQNKDGTPNQYFAGALVWMDVKTNKQYQVKQMSLWVPKEGMKPELLQKGFTHFVTLNLEDDYQVTIVG